MTRRPEIPNEIKREVRKRCGFGCVICGSPVYEYDHIVEWSKTRQHKADELTLLCHKHHGEKTKKILPNNKVKASNDHPYNIEKGKSSPQSLYYDGNHFKLKLGDSISSFSDLKDGQTFSPFLIDGQPVVSFTNDKGHILLNLELKDDCGEVIIKIKDSELVYSTEFWDVEWVGKVLTIREGFRDILLELEFSPPSMISINRGTLRHNGVEIEIGREFVYCLNNRSFLLDCGVHGYGYGFALGDPVPDGPCGIVFSGIPRPVQDREGARKYMKQRLKIIKSHKLETRIREIKLQPVTLRGKLLFGCTIWFY